MNRSQGLNRRHALKLLAGGGAGATALTKMAGGAGLAAMLGAVPDPLEAAQVATRRGLPRLKITDIKVIQTQVGNTHMTNAKVFTSELGCTAWVRRPRRASVDRRRDNRAIPQACRRRTLCRRDRRHLADGVAGALLAGECRRQQRHERH